jgi:hypothetical protein
MSGQFDNLLKDIEGLTAGSEALAKALQTDGEDDEKIQAAAAGANAEGGEAGAAGSNDGGATPAGEGNGGDKPLVKSLTVKLPDGTEVEAADGAELLKAINDLSERVGKSEGDLAKALGGAVALMKSQSAVIKQQGDLLKSLSEQVKKLGGEGRGRKTTVVVGAPGTEQPLAKSETASMTPQEFMLKATSAFDNGKLSGKELTVIDVSLRSGQPIDPALIQKVVG